MVSLLYCHLYDHEPKKLTSSFSISSITCLTFIFLSLLELLQVLTINHPSLWMPKVDIFLEAEVKT